MLTPLSVYQHLSRPSSPISPKHPRQGTSVITPDPGDSHLPGGAPGLGDRFQLLGERLQRKSNPLCHYLGHHGSQGDELADNGTHDEERAEQLRRNAADASCNSYLVILLCLQSVLAPSVIDDENNLNKRKKSQFRKKKCVCVGNMDPVDTPFKTMNEAHVKHKSHT